MNEDEIKAMKEQIEDLENSVETLENERYDALIKREIKNAKVKEMLGEGLFMLVIAWIFVGSFLLLIHFLI